MEKPTLKNYKQFATDAEYLAYMDGCMYGLNIAEYNYLNSVAETTTKIVEKR